MVLHDVPTSNKRFDEMSYLQVSRYRPGSLPPEFLDLEGSKNEFSCGRSDLYETSI